MSRPLVRALTSPYQPLLINSPNSQSRTAAACGGCSMIFPNYNGRRRPVLLLAINVKLEGSCNNIYDSHRESRGGGGNIIRNAAVLAAATTMVVMMMSAVNVNAEPDDTTLSNIPQMLSGSDCNKKARIQRPKSRKAESCTIKCVGTCIRGGGGSPGEGPLNVRRPLVVFKQGFRTRQYCLVECSDICNLIGDGDDGP